ncbi:hypothetical protein [Longibacter salinarum]|nr:hypothetical protein [Longibacter salinarum]
MTRRISFYSASLILLLFATALAGCVSTKERYQRVQKYEKQGKPVAAAFEMVKVLDDDSSWPNGRQELNELAQAGMDMLMETSRQKLSQNAPLDALGALDRIDNLRSACRSVSVSVNEPTGYRSLRREAVDESFAYLMDRGENAETDGRWSVAADAYENAREFAPTNEALREIDARQADVYMAWAEMDMDQGAYRSAFDRADVAASYVSEASPMIENVEALQDAAVARGTKVTAFLPLWQTRQAGAALPPDFLREVNDVLNLRYWSKPPIFIASVPPVPTRRAVRRDDLDRTILSRKQASRIGRILESDLVVTGEIVEFREERDDIESVTQTAQWSVSTPDGREATRGRSGTGPRDTTFVVKEYDRELYATIEIRVIDTRSGRTLSANTIGVDVEDRMVRGEFSGDWRNLDLSGMELSLFHPEDLRAQERELELKLADALADAVARETFDDLVQTIR